MKVEGASFTVVGAARSGLAAANYLARHGALVRLVDHNDDLARPDGLHASVEFAKGTNAVRVGDVAILSPGIPEVSPVRAEIEATASEAIGEMELFGRLCPSPIIAVTGTDGKSTVTTMIGAILREQGLETFVGGNLGNPLTTDLDKMSASSVAVAEVSCFQLTSCHTFRPKVAVVTNIAVDHVDYHGSFEAYQAAKRRVARSMAGGDTLVLNGDDPRIAMWSLNTDANIVRFSVSGNATAQARYADDALWLGDEKLIDRAELPLLGDHNVANALAASLAAQSFGAETEVIRRALAGYEALPHRLRAVATVGGVRWINDSKATNPNAAGAALRSMVAPTILLAGGSVKEADFRELGTLISERTKAAILFGETREALAAAISASHPTLIVSGIEEAVAQARRLAESGDVVLLSPACASYDQFRSYAHRGEVFEALVRGLRS